MGCCVTLPSKEDMLINFWNNLPLRNISVVHYRDSIVNTYSPICKVDSIMAFRKFFLNESFLVYGNSDTHLVCKSLFEDLIVHFTPKYVIFHLAFLCDFDIDHKKNSKALYDISDYFNLDIVRYDNNEYYFEKYKLTETIKTFVEVIFNFSIRYVFAVTEENEYKDYKDYLQQKYSIHVLNSWVNDFMHEAQRKMLVSEFLEKNINLISDLYYFKIHIDRFIKKL
jgi:hypothetical protein